MPYREPFGKRKSILKTDAHCWCLCMRLRKLLPDPVIRLHERTLSALVSQKELVLGACHIPRIDLAIVVDALEPTEATSETYLRGESPTLLVRRLQISDKALFHLCTQRQLETLRLLQTLACQ